jgi:hypothetical protein
MRSGRKFHEVWPNKSPDLLDDVSVTSGILFFWDYNKGKGERYVLMIGEKQHFIPVQKGLYTPEDYAAIAAKVLELVPGTDNLVIEAS